MHNNKPHPPLRHLVIRSSMWIFGSRIGAQVLRLFSNLVMTRLLVPEMFGVMTIANTVLLCLSLCAHIGIKDSIVQNPRGDERLFLDTAWVTQIIKELILFFLALCISVGLYFANTGGLIPVDSTYAYKDLPLILAVMSFTLIFSGFNSTKLETASRHMALGRITVIELSTQLLGILAMISFALVHPSVWALVFGSLVSSLAYMLASHFVLPGHHNRFDWDKDTFREIFDFGIWIFFNTMIGFFAKNAEKFVFGALIAPEMLAFYGIAMFMTSAVSDILSGWAQSVALPVLSRKFREHGRDISNAYYKLSLPFNVATLFLCGFLYNAGYIVIEVLYDDRYSSAGHMMQVLSLCLLGVRTGMSNQFYQAIGKPKLMLPVSILQLVMMLGLLTPAYHQFGMEGALYIIVLTNLLPLPVSWYFLKKYEILDWKQELISFPALILGYLSSKLFVMAYNSIKAFL